MSFQPPYGTFKVEPPVITTGWQLPAETIPQFDNIEADKLRFGRELGQRLDNPWLAAQRAFPGDDEKALWVSRNWLNDLIVNTAKEQVLISVKNDDELVDKDAFCKAILDDIRSMDAELKDRVAGYKLLAEIKGFIGKNVEPTGNQFNINELTVKFVGKEDNNKPEIKTIEAKQEEFDDPIKLKLVSSR